MSKKMVTVITVIHDDKNDVCIHSCLDYLTKELTERKDGYKYISFTSEEDCIMRRDTDGKPIYK